MKKFIFGNAVHGPLPSLGLLLARVAFGGFMLFGHGWGKMMSFSTLKDKFPDPLGLGGTLSLGGAVASEVLFAALILVGFMTRLSALPLIFTMAIAAFIVHGDDPFKGQEMALLYLVGYLLLLLTGPGCFSLDHLLGKKSKLN